MKEIDYMSFYKINKKEISYWILINLISLLFFIGSIISFLLTINYFNRGYLIPIGTAVTCIFLFLTLFIFSCCLLPRIKRKKHLESILSCKRVRYIGQIESIDKQSAITKYSTGYIITISDKNNKYKIFYDNDLEELPFKKKDKIDVITGEGFILSYQVKK